MWKTLKRYLVSALLPSFLLSLLPSSFGRTHTDQINEVSEQVGLPPPFRIVDTQLEVIRLYFSAG